MLAWLVDPEEKLRVYRAANTAMQLGYTDAQLAAFISGPRVTRRVLWLGVLNDASVLLALGAFAVSWGWFSRMLFLPTPAGECARCGYTLAGLRSGAPCPECGKCEREGGKA